MILHTNPGDFRDAITATSKALGIRETFIEKDYWLTLALRNLSQSKYKDQVVFKGGTSLSKAHGVIQRFSEDIDLAILQSDSFKNNQIKSLLRSIEKEMMTEPLTEDPNHPLVSKGSRFRKTAHNYPKQHDDSSQDLAARHLILEINSFANPTPHQDKTIVSYIAEQLGAKDQAFVDEYDLQSFRILVLEEKRTFAEKIMGLVRASYQSDSTFSGLKAKIRHIYDLVKLLEQESIHAFLHSPHFFEILGQVRKDDARNKEFQGAWTEKKTSIAPIFQNHSSVMEHLRLTYEQEFPALLFQSESLPALEKVAEAFDQIKKRLAEYDETV